MCITENWYPILPIFEKLGLVYSTIEIVTGDKGASLTG